MSSTRLPSLSRRKLSHYYEQLATLLNAGLPAGRAFAVLADQAGGGRLRRFSIEAANAVASGRSLSDIFASHEGLFGTAAVQMIAAADTSGRLPETFAALAGQTERERAFRSSLITGLIYPLVLAHIAIFLVPISQVVGSGGGLDAYLVRVAIIIVPLYVVVGICYALWRWSRLAPGAGEVVDTIIVHLPYFGTLVRKTATARFCRTYGSLIEAGAGVHRSLAQAAGATGNHAMRRAIESAIPAVDRGEPLSASLAATRLFPRHFVELLRTGEETGEVPQMLQRMADAAELDTVTSFKRLSVALPFLFYLVVMGAIALFIISFWLRYFGQITSLGG